MAVAAASVIAVVIFVLLTALVVWSIYKIVDKLREG